MSRTYPSLALQASVQSDFARGFAPRRKRDRNWFFTPPEVWGRCAECATHNHAHQSHIVFDRARDWGLLRRDVNEMLETITLEALA